MKREVFTKNHKKTYICINLHNILVPIVKTVDEEAN